MTFSEECKKVSKQFEEADKKRIPGQEVLGLILPPPFPPIPDIPFPDDEPDDEPEDMIE